MHTLLFFLLLFLFLFVCVMLCAHLSQAAVSTVLVNHTGAARKIQSSETLFMQQAQASSLPPASVFQAGDLLVNKSCVWPPTLRSFGSRPPAAALRGSASPVKSPASFINVRWTINTVVKLLQKIHFPRTRMRKIYNFIPPAGAQMH